MCVCVCVCEFEISAEKCQERVECCLNDFDQLFSVRYYSD